jgi:hypothetical protein
MVDGEDEIALKAGELSARMTRPMQTRGARYAVALTA